MDNNLIEAYRLAKQTESKLRKLVIETHSFQELLEAGLEMEAAFKHRANTDGKLTMLQSKKFVDMLTLKSKVTKI